LAQAESRQPFPRAHCNLEISCRGCANWLSIYVDAVLFWMVYDPEKAALEVQDYAQAVTWAAQTALRDIIA
jgi:hypothetical protein